MPAPHRPDLTLDATCSCGAIRVELRGSARLMLLCSCEDCQKASGTGHAAVVGLRAEDVRISGEVARFERPADSGAVFTRCFCPRCGTPISGRSSRTPDLVLLPVGLFAPTNDWFLPNQLIFARSHHAWDSIAAELPRHATYRVGNAV